MTLAYKTGYCDAVMNRAPFSEWKDYAQQSAYLKGYLAGQLTGVKLKDHG